jgi:dipeptidyl aminopeptidase/acylaminoacyl peptidase
VAPSDVQVLLGELAGWAAAQGRAPRTCRYGSGPEQVADLRLPDGDGRHRVAVLLHGGFWRARFTRATMAALAVDLAGRGWATWNVEYRRVGNGGGVPETLEDVGAALDELPRAAPELAGDGVVVIGHSAGGQLGLCVAARPSVTAVVSLAGVCDLQTAARQRIGEDATVEFIGGTPSERPGAYRSADPLALLPSGVRVLLVHGDADGRVPVQQSRRYARAALAVGDRCELLELRGVDHFAVIDPRTPTCAAVAERLEDLVS